MSAPSRTAGLVAHALILVALACVPLLANWPVVTGWLTVDPIFSVSGLGTHLLPGPLPGVTNLDPNAGVTTEALGHFAAQEWIAGRIPWWNPYSGIGLPLPAEGQNQALFLPFVLLLALRNGPLLLLLALQEVAAFSTFALLRQMGFARPASWIGGALFAMNGTFAWFGHGPMMPIAFLPLLLLGIELDWAAAQSRHLPGWPVASLAVALSLFAGFPETAYLDALLGVAWALVRLVQCDASRRIPFAIQLGLGAFVGVLLSAPFTVPFAHMLSVSDLGMHSASIGAIGAPPEALSILTLPYLLGPLTFGAAEGGPILWLWAFMGGYLSLPVATLALAALLSPRTSNRSLRWMLAAWIILTVGASFKVPGITQLVYAVPGLSRIQIFRYAPPSWMFAGIALASMAIDDWLHGEMGIRWVALALAITGTAICSAVIIAEPAVFFLRAHVAHYDPWLAGSLLWAATVTLAASFLLASKPQRWRPALLAVLLVCDGAALFSIPRLAGLRNPSLDTKAVQFLREHIGLDRVYSLGALVPNYPAYFRIAEVNQDYMPTPEIWTEHIGTALDPTTDRNAFSGRFQWPGLARPDHIAEFRKRAAAFEALGVRYVLVPSGESLFPTVRPAIGSYTRGVDMKPGASLDTTPSIDLPFGDIDTVSVVIGTYQGTADGSLSVAACTDAGCSHGLADLATAPDNTALALRLDHPLRVGPGTGLRLHFEHTKGTASLVIWEANETPDVAFAYSMPGFGARLVFADQVMSVYELDHPAPYFTTEGGNCQLDSISRIALRASCNAPARLNRRELFFPGWHATVNELPAPIGRADPIMQTINLPVGQSSVVFDYTPPYTTASSVAFFTGLFLVLAGFTNALRRTEAVRG